MQFVKPKVSLIGVSEVVYPGLTKYLTDLGAQGWGTDTESDGEMLIEVAGKTCYKSFKPELNENLTGVTDQDNEKYIGNILKQRHGSVLEHVLVSFGFHDVSRIFTHELVRHRPASYSQESLRFVRLTQLRGYLPEVFQRPFLDQIREHLDDGSNPLGGYSDTSELEDQLKGIFQETFEYLESVQRELTDLLQLDKLEKFSDKKKLTSAMRRLAPEGLATTIIASTNLRQWRHEIEVRTSRHAEEEIRFVFQEVYEQLRKQFPNVFQDATALVVDGMLEVTFDNSKV
jgi:thymidylate synthase (FAD)